MNRVLATLVFASFAGGAHAQRGEPQSHFPLEGGPSSEEISRLLKERLDLLDQRKHDADLLRKLIEQWQRDQDPEALRRFVEQNEELRDPETLERLKEFAQGELRDTAGGAAPPPDLKRLSEQLRRLRPPAAPPPSEVGDGTPPSSRGGGGPPPVGRALPPPPEEVPPPEENQRSRRWNDFADRYLDGVEETPAFQNMVDDLSQGGLDELTRDRFWDEYDWSEFQQQGNDFAQWLNGKVGDPRGWDLPEIGGLRMPSFSGGGHWGGAADGTSTPAEGPASWAAVIILGAVGAAAIFGYWYFYRPARRRAEAKPRHRAVADWPVEPERVRSADEFIRAFEHLAIWRCGEPARTWHHRAVGDDLARQQPGESAEARELAGLYAHARYAPRHEPLDAGQVETARRSLRLFSGEMA